MKTRVWLICAAAVLAACGESAQPTAGADTRAAAVPLTGVVHEIGMVSGGGERFEPDVLEARRGDVLRFELVAGVHNASFSADRNPAGVRLPEATPLMQFPGQTHDITVDLPPGEYFFQCDPHVALGMVGTLIVRE